MLKRSSMVLMLGAIVVTQAQRVCAEDHKTTRSSSCVNSGVRRSRMASMISGEMPSLSAWARE